MNVFILIILFLSSQTVPDGTTQMTIEVDGQPLKWTKTEDGKWKTVFPGQKVESLFKIDGNKMMLEIGGQPEKVKDVDMSAFLKLTDKMDWKTVKEVEPAEPRMGGPFVLTRDAAKSQLTITQKEGPAAGRTFTVTYGKAANKE